MKTKVTKVLIAALASTLIFAGCYGNFSLTRKLYEINGNVGDKWVNSIVTWVMLIIPIYEIAGFVDFVALNVVEFWTGSNPITLRDGQEETQIVQRDGKTYKITARKNRMEVSLFDGEKFRREVLLTYSEKHKTWSAGSKDGQITLARVRDGNTMDLIGPGGRAWTYDLSTGKVSGN